MTTPKYKEVSQERFNEVVTSHRFDSFTLSLQGWEVAVLYGVISLALKCLDMRGTTGFSTFARRRWRNWCLDIMSSWGFTPEELAWLGEAEEVPGGLVTVPDSDAGSAGGFLTPEERQAIAELDATIRYPSGIGRMDRGECPRYLKFPSACIMCNWGHLLECHYPLTCKEARCSQYDAGE